LKILFVGDQLKDLVSDPLYVGLVRTLGQRNVIDYPSKAILHTAGEKLWFLPQYPDLGYTEQEIRSMLNAGFFDLVCVTTPRPECLMAFEELYVGRFPPIVFIDGADDPCIRHDVVDRFPLAGYFKREYVWKGTSQTARFISCARSFRFDRKLFAKTFPLQISVVLDEIPKLDAKADIDVSFYGHVSHIKRVKAIQLLEGLRGEGIKVSTGLYGSPTDRKYKLQPTALRRLLAKVLDPTCVSGQDVKRKLAPVEYYRTIVRSKMAVSIRGGGFDTYRYWEIVACRRLLLSEPPDIVIPHDFENRKHAVFCRPDLKDLPELVRYYRDHDEEREAIAAEGFAHLLKHHTCERRAEYFLEICSRVI
jgi:hypothetical protein